MMKKVVKLQRHGDQYRIGLPRELVIKAGFEDVEIVMIERIVRGSILITEYHGKGKEKRGISKNRS